MKAVQQEVFQTKYYRTYSDHEKGGGNRITEQAGYIPPDIQIQNMILAGKRLEASRLYDLENGEEDGDVDPLRKPGIDLAEVDELKAGVKARLKKQFLDNLEKKQKNEEKEEKPEEGSSGDSGDEEKA